MAADMADIQGMYDSPLFKLACQDVARIVSIMSIESQDFTKPRPLNGTAQNLKDKFTFFWGFFYMVFLKGFTPTVFDMMPYSLWYALTVSIYVYRLVVLPFWLRLTGYGKYASWTDPALGSKQPKAGDKFSKPYAIKDKSYLTAEGPLAKVNFGDPEFEKMISCLIEKKTHLAPHTRSPGHPFVQGYPGNFLNHLTGVYKVLIAWQQPQYVVRGGLFHSVYGTFDYRSGIFDLRDGRKPLEDVIGCAAEELAFIICTSDRIGLMTDLTAAMYGKEAKSYMGAARKSANDGNWYPPLQGTVGAEGFPVRNHITQAVHIMPPDLFAQFIVVFMADFMDQGALGLGSEDQDICLFQFLRFRFFNDVLRFVKPYVRVMPPVFEKYMGSHDFHELLRTEVIALKSIWSGKVYKALKVANPQQYVEGSNGVTKDVVASAGIADLVGISSEERALLLTMIKRCPYLAEPKIALACALKPQEKYEVRNHCKSDLASDDVNGISGIYAKAVSRRGCGIN
jgi:hypothetical protein